MAWNTSRPDCSAITTCPKPASVKSRLQVSRGKMPERHPVVDHPPRVTGPHLRVRVQC